MYISASHLFPEAIEEGKQQSLFSFLGGVTLAVNIVALECAILFFKINCVTYP